MSATPEDVKVRLTSEGVDDIVKAFRSIEKEADKAGRNSAASFKKVGSAGIDLKRTLTTLGIIGAVTGLISFIKTTNKLANEAGRTAEKLGTTSEAISVLRAQAKLSNVENEQLELGLTNLTDSVGKLINGTKEQVNAFARLGISLKDLEGKDTAEQFDLIASKVTKFGDSASKTRGIIDVFGKRVGPNLIPLLNDLGEKGFAKAREEAERFGLVIDSQTAAAANAVENSFDLMGAQVRGLATQFLSGLAPVVATVMEDFRNDVAGTGVTAAQEFGQKTGTVLRNIIEFFQIAGRSIGAFFAKQKVQMDAINEANDALRRGDKKAADAIVASIEKRKEAIQDEFNADVDRIKMERAASEQRAADLVKEAAARAKRRQSMQDDLLALEKQQAAVEKKKKTDETLLKLEKEQAELMEKFARNREKAGEEAKKIEVDILEATGSTTQAKIQALDDELMKQRQIFAEAGRLTAEQEARISKLRDVKVAQINFEDIKTKGERALDELAIARQRIEQDVELGISTQFEGVQRILNLEKERLPILQQLAAAALAAAQATGSPEAIAAAEAFAAQVRQVQISVNNVSNTMQQFKNAGVESFQGALKGLLVNLGEIHSVEDAFRSLASTVLDSLAQIAADILAKQATFALLRAFGGGFGFAGGGAVPAVAAATGGHIRGAGTATSDSIPAWLSNGEFVVNAATVRQPGVLDMLHALNRRVHVPRMGPRRYAQGGLVEAPVRSDGSGGVARLEIGLEDGLTSRLIESPSGTKALIRTYAKNKRSFQSAGG